MSVKPKVPGAIQALTILIPAVAIIQLPAAGYLFLAGPLS